MRTVVGKKEEEYQRDRQNKSLNGTAKCPQGVMCLAPGVPKTTLMV